MVLTVLSIKNARAREKAYKLSDEHSLFLLVMPTGAKYWRLRYRVLGRQKTLSFGVWPEVSLAEARDKRDAARKLIADGIDPGVEKKRRRLRAQFDTTTSFRSVADEWIIKITREGRAEITLEKVRWLLGMVNPSIGDLPINQIEALDVLAVSESWRRQANMKALGGCEASSAGSCAMASPPAARSVMLPPIFEGRSSSQKPSTSLR